MRVFVIAEAGVNHNGSLLLAKELIDAASCAGADVIKFQSFDATKLVTKKAEKARYQIINTSNNDSQLKMLKELQLSIIKTTTTKKERILITPRITPAILFISFN